jgi:hypothetical protein
MKILILSSSLFTDRILNYSSILNVYPKANFTVWQNSHIQTNKSVLSSIVNVKEFTEISPLSEKLNFLRKVNDLAWSYQLNAVSIKSMRNFKTKNSVFNFNFLVLNILGRLVSVFSLNNILERVIFKLSIKLSNSLAVRKKLIDGNFDLVVSTNPFWEREREVCLEVKKLSIPIASFIPSWDNITTKSRLVFEPDYYILWSEIRKNELHKYYPNSQNKPVFIVGAPQYDILLNERYYVSKNEFFKQYELDPTKPTILYALGSPNFLSTEYDGVKIFVDLFVDKGLNLKYNLIIRPHPNKVTRDIQESFLNYKNIAVQQTKLANLNTANRTQNLDEIVNWVNTFRYSELIINLSSTVIFDGLFFDKEIININFDPSPELKFHDFIKDINENWIHLKPLFNHCAINYVNDFSEMFDKIESTLRDELFSPEVAKQQLFEEVCGLRDGLNGQRFGNSIIECGQLVMNNKFDGV